MPQINVEVNRIKAAQVGQETWEASSPRSTARELSRRRSDYEKTATITSAAIPRRGHSVVETLFDLPLTDKLKVPFRCATWPSQQTTAPTEINHFNITRVTDVFVNVRGRDVGSVAAAIEKFLAQIRRDRAQVPEGYFIQMRGEVKAMRESFKSLGFGFALAVVLVYLVMVFQFRSFLDPFIVMFAVPLGLIGVAWMLFATGTSLNIQSVMGTIMMVGIVVSFSVLLVEFANRVRG